MSPCHFADLFRSALPVMSVTLHKDYTINCLILRKAYRDYESVYFAAQERGVVPEVPLSGWPKRRRWLARLGSARVRTQNPRAPTVRLACPSWRTTRTGSRRRPTSTTCEPMRAPCCLGRRASSRTNGDEAPCTLSTDCETSAGSTHRSSSLGYPNHGPSGFQTCLRAFARPVDHLEPTRRTIRR